MIGNVLCIYCVLCIAYIVKIQLLTANAINHAMIKQQVLE